MSILPLIAYIYLLVCLRRNVILSNKGAFFALFSYTQIGKNFTICTKMVLGFIIKGLKNTHVKFSDSEFIHNVFI